jgi:hypothetical protein
LDAVLRASLLLLALGLAAPRIDAAPPLDPDLDADAIYRRVLDNRFEASVQEISLVSGDRVGREQSIRLQMLWRRYPERSDEILSHTLIRYLEPADLRGAGYLVISKEDSPADQFVYLPSVRRTRRVSLRGETVIGTDLSIEDIMPRELEDASYVRRPDAQVADRSCYAIEATPAEHADSQYGKLLIYVEPDHFVPLQTRFWDRAGVEVKELRVVPKSIRQVRGIWLPLQATMHHHLEGSYTQIRVLSLTPDPELPKPYFTQRQLERRKLRLPRELTDAALHFEAIARD